MSTESRRLTRAQRLSRSAVYRYLIGRPSLTFGVPWLLIVVGFIAIYYAHPPSTVAKHGHSVAPGELSRTNTSYSGASFERTVLKFAHVGVAAPDFTVINPKGEPISLS